MVSRGRKAPQQSAEDRRRRRPPPKKTASSTASILSSIPIYKLIIYLVHRIYHYWPHNSQSRREKRSLNNAPQEGWKVGWGGGEMYDVEDLPVGGWTRLDSGKEEEKWSIMVRDVPLWGPGIGGHRESASRRDRRVAESSLGHRSWPDLKIAQLHGVTHHSNAFKHMDVVRAGVSKAKGSAQMRSQVAHPVTPRPKSRPRHD